MSDPREPRPDVTQDSTRPRRILENQEDDVIDLQTEQEIRRREIETIHEYSLRLLEAQLVDRQREREHQRSTNTNSSLIIGFLSLLLTAGICYALYLNKDQLVMEFFKAILFLVTGGLGGYSIKLVKDKSEASKH